MSIPLSHSSHSPSTRVADHRDGPLVLQGSREGAVKMMAYIALAGAFVVNQMLLFWDPANSVRIAMFGALLLLAASVILHFAYRVVRPGTVIIVDALGIVDQASGGGAGRVFWKEIESAHIYQFAQFRTLRIVPRDFEAIVRRQSAWKRCYYRAVWGLGSPPINIPQELVPVPIEDLLAIINERVGGVSRP